MPEPMPPDVTIETIEGACPPVLLHLTGPGLDCWVYATEAGRLVLPVPPRHQPEETIWRSPSI